MGRCGPETHLPVFGLVDALRIGPRKAALAVEGGDGGTELGHGVEVGGEVVQHGDNVGGERRSLRPLFGNPVHLQGWREDEWSTGSAPVDYETLLLGSKGKRSFRLLSAVPPRRQL